MSFWLVEPFTELLIEVRHHQAAELEALKSSILSQDCTVRGRLP